MAKGIGHRYGFLLSVITSLFGRLALSKCGPAPPVALEMGLSAEEKRHEKITLTTVTTTPRARSLSASYLRERTPVGELPPARRKRLKAESSARSRAMCRLYPERHAQHKAAECARKRLASGEAALQYGPWQQKARDRIKAERSAWCEAKRQRECDEIIAHDKWIASQCHPASFDRTIDCARAKGTWRD